MDIGWPYLDGCLATDPRYDEGRRQFVLLRQRVTEIGGNQPYEQTDQVVSKNKVKVKRSVSLLF